MKLFNWVSSSEGTAHWSPLSNSKVWTIHSAARLLIVSGRRRGKKFPFSRPGSTKALETPSPLVHRWGDRFSCRKEVIWKRKTIKWKKRGFRSFVGIFWSENSFLLTETSVFWKRGKFEFNSGSLVKHGPYLRRCSAYNHALLFHSISFVVIKEVSSRPRRNRLSLVKLIQAGKRNVSQDRASVFVVRQSKLIKGPRQPPTSTPPPST